MASPAAREEPRPIVIPAIASDGRNVPVEKMEAHRKGLLHHAISVFLFRGEELLIQQRAAGKYHCGLLWANTCCSHPHWGEDVRDAASRRLREELGVTVPLTPRNVVTYRADVGGGLVEHERVQVFRGDLPHGAGRIAPDPAEVAALRWATPAALMTEAKAAPAAFAPWFRIYLHRWDELGL